MDADDTIRANIATTGMLIDGGIALMRQNIRRRNPGHTEQQVDTALDAWLYRTNDPIPGDISGRVRVRDKVR